MSGPPRLLPTIVGLQGNLHLPSNSRLRPQRDISGLLIPAAAVFLDRDGVMVEDVHFLRSPEQLRILPGFIEALRMLQERFYIIVVTNQSGIARGLLGEDELLAIHLELVRRLSAASAIVDALYYCPHLPESPMPNYGIECDCRKPRPGMLLRAVQDWGIDVSRSFMVGDKPRDIEAGRAAGVNSILICGEKADHPERSLGALSMIQAARIILEQAAL